MTYLAIALVAVLGFGFFTSWTFSPDNLGMPDGDDNTPPSNQGGQQVTNPSDYTNVNKPVKFTVTDLFAGGALPGTTNAIYIYDNSANPVQLENLSLSSSQCTTGDSYPSGTVLNVKYIYDTTADEVQWFRVVVPQMLKSDTDSTTNPVSLKGHDLPTLTDLVFDGAGTTYADAADINMTLRPTGTITYSWAVATTGDGYITSYDPIYDIEVKPMIWAVVSGTGYNQITLTGFDGKFESGSAIYYYRTITDDQFTKQAAGNGYVTGRDGSGSFSFSYSGAAYTGNATTIQLYAQAYANEDYMRANTDYGPYNAELAESTIELFLQTD